ncbi:hypothetical protein ACX1C1_21400 [Paenibacillus sp. strain BS8-2]
MQMMYSGMVNSPVTELAAAINNSQTTATLVNGAALPAAPNLAVIGQGELAETILYTGKSGNNLSGITRGLQGSPRSWGAGSKIARNFTERDYESMRQNIENHDAQLADITNPPRAEYRSNLNKACPTFEWTSPDWNVQTYDTDEFLDSLDPTRININTSGVYLINAWITIEENVNGQRNIQVVKNADNEAIGYITGFGSANATRLNVTTTAYLNVGEYIRIRVYQDDFPNTLNILGTSSTGPGSKFSIIKLCPP